MLVFICDVTANQTMPHICVKPCNITSSVDMVHGSLASEEAGSFSVSMSTNACARSRTLSYHCGEIHLPPVPMSTSYIVLDLEVHCHWSKIFFFILFFIGCQNGSMPIFGMFMHDCSKAKWFRALMFVSYPQTNTVCFSMGNGVTSKLISHANTHHRPRP